MYKKELLTAEEMNLIFNKSKIVLHEGVGIHFRVFDAMMAGIPIIIRKSKQDSEFGGIGTFFKNNIDYISVDINNDEYKTFNFHSKELEKISFMARKKVLSNHTWFHRLYKVVKDIDELY